MAGSKMAVEPGTNPGIARKLASSDKGTREKAVAVLLPWLSCQLIVEEDELKKIWKGLFYCVWHSDKAPVQAELIERLAALLETVEVELSVSFFKVFLSTMRREWGGIDRLRLDKFYLLLRKFLSHMFKVLENGRWDKMLVIKFMDAMKERAFLAKDRFPALGVNLHLIDIFWDEFSKVLPVPDGTLELLLEPFYSITATSSDKALLRRVRENIFNPLLVDAHSLISKVEKKQSLDGATGSSIGLMVNSTPVAPRLFDLASDPAISQANRKVLYELNEEFSKLAWAFDSLKGTNAFDLDTRPCMLNGITTEETGKSTGTRLEDINGGSRTRSRKRQGNGLDVAQVEGVGGSKVKKPKKLKVEQAAPENGGSRVGNQKALVGDVDLSHVDAKVGKDGKDKAVKKKRSYEASSLIPARSGLPLLQKMSSLKRKAKKRKKGQSKLVQVDSVDGGLGSVLEPEASRSGRVFGTNGHRNNGAQPPILESNGPANGHQDINEVTMNLEKIFDIVAAADESSVQSPASGTPVSGITGRSPLKSRNRKLMKKGMAVTQSTSLSAGSPNGTANLPISSPVPKSPTTEAEVGGQSPPESAKKKKKVRFVLRNNLICKPHAPLPPLSVRTPPSATPRGSALKSGVLPGPIRTRPIRIARGSSLSKSRKRASRQLLTMSMQKPKSSTRKLRNRQSL